jgi:hypothetical protein
MKKLLLLSIVAFTTVLGYAQGPEKANAIIITMPDSNTISDKVLKILTSKDYIINKGKNASVITTMPKALKSNTRLALNAQLKGADIILTGKLVIAAQGSMTVNNNGTKGTPVMNAWEEMDKIAKAFGGKVKYELK